MNRDSIKDLFCLELTSERFTSVAKPWDKYFRGRGGGGLTFSLAKIQTS